MQKNAINRLINQIIDVSPIERRNDTLYNNYKGHKDYIQKVSIDERVISGGASVVKQYNCEKLDNKTNCEQQSIYTYATDKCEYGFNFSK